MIYKYALKISQKFGSILIYVYLCAVIKNKKTK